MRFTLIYLAIVALCIANVWGKKGGDTGEEDKAGSGTGEKGHGHGGHSGGKKDKEDEAGGGTGEKGHGHGGHSGGKKDKEGGRGRPKSQEELPMDGCICSVWGDPHHKIPSGHNVDFQGDCTYIIFRDAINDPPTFTVFASNTFRDSKSTATQQEEIFVNIRSPDIENPYKFTFLRDGIELNGERINIPYYTPDGKTRIKDHEKKGIVLITDDGFWITWDWKYRTGMRAPPEFENHIDGMCNCVYDTENPLILRDGTALPITDENAALWGNSWKLDECADVQPMPPITDTQRKVYGNDDWCGIMKKEDGPFKPLVGDPSQNIQTVIDEKFDACVYDMAYTENEEIFCSDLEDLKEFAEENGIMDIRFRLESFCPMECDMMNSVYKEDVSACVNSCEFPEAESECLIGRTDGCECIEGYIKSGRHCVRKEECGCYDTTENRYYANGQSWMSQDCRIRSECYQQEINTNSTGCSENSICETKFGDRGCFRCAEGFEGDGRECTPVPFEDQVPIEDEPDFDDTPVDEVEEPEVMPTGPTVPCDESTKTFACTRAAGCCRSSCANNEHPIANVILCGQGLTCCSEQRANDVPCAHAMYGGYCTTHDDHEDEDKFCPDSMNTNFDVNYCEGFGGEATSRPFACCKPVVRDGMVYDPAPQIDDDGHMVMPKPPPGPVLPPGEEGEGEGPPGLGIPVGDDFLQPGDTLAGVAVPEIGTGPGMPGAGEKGDPKITTFDKRTYQFQGKSCTYMLVRECSEPDNNSPLFRITTTHVKSLHFGKPSVSVGHVTVHYGGTTVKLEEGDKVEVDGEVQTISAHAWTVFDNGKIRIRYDFKNEISERVVVQLLNDDGDVLIEVRYNGHGHDIVTIKDDSLEVCGMLGNNNGNKHDDIQYREDGQWINVSDKNGHKMDDFANYWVTEGCTE